MRLKELQLSPEVGAFIDANRGDKSRASYIHSILQAAADGEIYKVLPLSVNNTVSTDNNQLRRIISNDNSTKHRS